MWDVYDNLWRGSEPGKRSTVIFRFDIRGDQQGTKATQPGARTNGSAKPQTNLRMTTETREQTNGSKPSSKPDQASSTSEDSWRSLIAWADVPHWMQDNAHIHTNYRQASYSYVRSFASIFHLHNESVNIWTHLVPALLSLPTGWALYTVLKPRYDRASSADILAMGCFFMGAALCLGMSATFHTLSNHSPQVAKFWNQLDYAGIACLITGSFIPSVYYGFFCDPLKQRLYWTMVSPQLASDTMISELTTIQICTLGIACTAVSVMPRFRTPAWRPVRAAMFVGMGLSAIFPVIDGLFVYGLDQMTLQIGLFWLSLQGALYVLGAGLYAVSVICPHRIIHTLTSKDALARKNITWKVRSRWQQPPDLPCSGGHGRCMPPDRPAESIRLPPWGIRLNVCRHFIA